MAIAVWGAKEPWPGSTVVIVGAVQNAFWQCATENRPSARPKVTSGRPSRPTVTATPDNAQPVHVPLPGGWLITTRVGAAQSGVPHTAKITCPEMLVAVA